MRLKTTVITLVFATAFGLLGGCQQSTRTTEPRSVKVDTPATTLVSYADLFRGGERVGSLQTRRYEDGSEKRVTFVYDQRNRSAGYILSDGRSYRHTVHDGTQLVSESGETWRNAAAVLGMAGTRLNVRVAADVNRAPVKTGPSHTKPTGDDEG